MNEISCSELETILENQPTAFLCGNGFSINFDHDFGNIYDRIFNAHKMLIRNGKFDVKANTMFKKVFTENYKSVLKYVYTYNEKNFCDLFLDGVSFAESIITNKSLLEKLEQDGYIHTLVFGKSEIDLVESIANVGKIKGYKYVNIEYWSILIYMYFAINTIGYDDYKFPSGNEFITLIKVGNINKNKIVQESDDIHQYPLSNGFNIYYRMLFSTAILCDGKAIDFSALENKSEVNLKRVRKFLNKFQTLLTLNYDHILESVSSKEVYHIHGEYVINKQEYVYFQSLGIQLDSNTYVSFSDILIGDYFVNKTFAGMINSLNKNSINKKIISISNGVGNNLRQNKVEAVVIFGMNIDNDQHILRDIMIELSDRHSDNIKLIYCYFTEQDREIFDEQYEASITFRKDVSERVRNMDVLYIRTQSLIKNYFN